MKVEESLTGQGQAGGEVVVASGPGSCGFPVAEGNSYLIDAGSYQGHLTTSLCSQSGELNEKRTQTLLRELRIRRSGERVDDLQVTLVPRDGGEIKTAPVRGVDVTLTSIDSGNILHAKTDTEGVLTMPVVPAGKYLLRAELPREFAIDQMFGQTWKGKQATIEIPEGQGGAACHYVMFVRPSGSISGKISDAMGKRNANAIFLIPVSPSSRSDAYPYIQDDGRFLIRFVAPGEYYLKYFADGDWEHPWFYPGVRTKEQARAITVGEGAQVEGVQVMLPAN